MQCPYRNRLPTQSDAVGSLEEQPHVPAGLNPLPHQTRRPPTVTQLYRSRPSCHWRVLEAHFASAGQQSVGEDPSPNRQDQRPGAAESRKQPHHHPTGRNWAFAVSPTTSHRQLSLATEAGAFVCAFASHPVGTGRKSGGTTTSCGTQLVAGAFEDLPQDLTAVQFL